MPRLPPRLLQQAARTDPLLAKLLPECRDLGSAQSELRWLRDHALDICSRKRNDAANPPNGTKGWRNLLCEFVSQRARGRPLQYILGSQPFGDLDILCRPGVLIPRLETEHYVERLAERLRGVFRRATMDVGDGRRGGRSKAVVELTHYPGTLRVLDVCTGTGCIALLLQRRLGRGLRERVQTLGVDYSEVAVGLALRNREHNFEGVVANDIGIGQDEIHEWVDFKLADLIPPPEGRRASSPVPYIKDYLKGHAGTEGQYWDILISNPPYVSERAYNDGTTTRSVRRYEPSDALVPGMEAKPESESGDAYYPYLLDLANHVKAKVVVVEVGDIKQAKRIAELIRTNFSGRKSMEDAVEIWKDWESDESAASREEDVSARAVVWWRLSWADLWMSRK